MKANLGPAFYSLPSGAWRDYVSLLHLPYTLWHLSYVVIGAAVVIPIWAARALYHRLRR